MLRVQVGVEDSSAVTNEPLQVERETTHSVALDTHRREVAVVGQRERADLLRICGKAVQLCHGSQLYRSGRSYEPPFGWPLPGSVEVQ
jgi:hypothetical protein